MKINTATSPKHFAFRLSLVVAVTAAMLGVQTAPQTAFAAPNALSAGIKTTDTTATSPGLASLDPSTTNTDVPTHGRVEYSLYYGTDGTGMTGGVMTLNLSNLYTAPVTYGGAPLTRTMVWESFPIDDPSTAGVVEGCVMPGSSISANRQVLTCALRNESIASARSFDVRARVLGGVPDETQIAPPIGSLSSASGSLGTLSSTTSNPITGDPLLGLVPLTVQAAPRWDIEKGTHFQNPASPSFWNQSGPAGEPGVILAYRISLFRQGSLLGNEALSSTVVLTDDFSGLPAGAQLLTWPTGPNGATITAGACQSAEGAGSGFENMFGYVLDQGPGNSSANNTVRNGGTCTASAVGSTATITITGLDARLEHYPTVNFGFGTQVVDTNNLNNASNRFYIAQKTLHFWVPMTNPVTLAPNFPLNVATSMSNVIQDANFPSVTGQQNIEPTETNNVRPDTFTARREGSFGKSYNALIPSNPVTARCDPRFLGACYVNFAEPGQLLVSNVQFSWDTSVEAIRNITMCETLDNSRLTFVDLRSVSERPIFGDASDDPLIGINVLETTRPGNGGDNSWTAVYTPAIGVGTWGTMNNVINPDAAPASTGSAQSDGSCEGPVSSTGPWFASIADLLAAGYTLQDVNRVRINVESIQPGQRIWMNIGLQVRATISYTFDDLLPTVTPRIAGDSTDGQLAPNTANLVSSEPWSSYAAGARANALPDALLISQAQYLKVSKGSLNYTTNGQLVPSGATVQYVITPNLSTPSVLPAPADVQVRDVLPPNIAYLPGTSTIGGSPVADPVIQPNTPIAGYTTLIYTLTNQVPISNTGPSVLNPAGNLPRIMFNAQINLTAPDATRILNAVTVDGPSNATSDAVWSAGASAANQNDDAGYGNPSGRSDAPFSNYVLEVDVPAGIIMSKRPLTPNIEIGDPMGFVLEYMSSSTLNNVEFIDTLPYNGDGRTPPTSYSGGYTLTGLISSTSAMTVLYSSKDPVTNAINPDPFDAGHNKTGTGTNGAGTTNWCTEAQFGTANCPATLADVKALLIQQATLPALSVRTITMTLATGGTAQGNVFDNQFSGKAQAGVAVLQSSNAVVNVVAATISGTVFYDPNNNGVRETEMGLANIPLTLTGIDKNGNPVLVNTQTDANGYYTFTNLVAGTYTVTQGTVPAPYLDGTDTAGILGGSTAVNDQISGIVIVSGGVAPNNNFAELLPADLQISKFDGPDPVMAGGTLTYTLYVTNTGPGWAYDVSITDTFPSGFNFVSYASNQPSCPGFPCNLAQFPAGATAVFTVTGTTDLMSGTLRNTAGVTASNDLTPTNNYAVADTQVLWNYDLAVVKADLADPIVAGSALTYVITVTNAGPALATDVRLTETLGANLTLNTLTPSQGTCAGAVCDLGTIYLTSTVQITVSVMTSASYSGTLTNTVSVGSPNGQDTNGANNTDIENTQSNLSADLSLVKTASADPVIAGQQLTYTLAISNAGPNEAPATTVTDTLPAGVTLVSVSASQGGCTAFPCALGTVPAYGSATITVVVTVNGTTRGTLVNSAGVQSAGSADPTPTNNIDEVTTTVSALADIGVSKTDGIVIASPGGSLTYQIVVSNTGPSDAVGVIVTDTLPAQLSGTGITCVASVGASCGAAQANPNVLSATLTLPVGGHVTFTVSATVWPTATGTITNTATATTPADTTETNPGNNAATDVDEITSGIAGRVYIDADGNGSDSGNTGIAGVVITLTGANGSLVTTTTGVGGHYTFTGLLPGVVYTLTEQQPAGFYDGIDTPGSIGGGVNASNDEIGGIVLASGQVSTGHLFGERQPGALSGYAYADTNTSGTFNSGDSPLSGVVLTLTGQSYAGLPVELTATTSLTGFYEFGNLPPGTYTVTGQQPANWNDATDTSGSLGGVAGNDVLSGIIVGDGQTGTDYNFGEVGTAISGRVYHDANANSNDDGETGLGGLIMTLTLPSGAQITTTTSVTGFYEFRQLEANVGYTITAQQPAGYASSESPTNQIVIASLPLAGSTGRDFGETLGSLVGGVFRDDDNSGAQNGVEPGLSGVLITLTGVDAAGQPVTRTTTTDMSGVYTFTGLLAGSYRITETQPTPYNDGVDTVGSAGGTLADDDISGIVLDPGENATGYTFGETGVSLSGAVWRDENRDGVLDGGEIGIGGVLITLTDSLGNVVSTTLTAPDGTYGFVNLPAGDYALIQEQPVGYGSSTSNTISLTLPLSGLANQNFGETLSSLSGSVWRDDDGSGAQNGSEPGIGGVLITLSGVDAAGASVLLTTTTDANGLYTFTLLKAGTYTATETQPVEYNDGLDTAGSAGGDASVSDVTSGIVLSEATDATGYTFGEVGTTLSGVVWVDADRNGQVDFDEAMRLGGVEIQLSDAAGNVMTTTTDATGAYTFTHLPAGVYTITQMQPVGFGSSTPNTRSVELTTSGLTNQNFGETQSTIQGSVFYDANNDGVQGAGEPGIEGVLLTLTGMDANGASVLLTTTTNADGRYLFIELLAGTYQISETQPGGYGDGIDTAGSAGGNASVNDVIASIPLLAGTGVTSYTFGETLGAVSGRVFEDVDADGLINGSDSGLAGVVVTLTLPNGTQMTTTTSALGTYRFDGLFPGGYTLTVGSGPATWLSTTVGERTGDVPTGGSLTNQNFGFRAPVQLSVAKRAVTSRTPVAAGTLITYTIRVTNTGRSLASGVIISDSVPTGTTLVAAPGAQMSGRVANWTVGNLSPGANMSVTLVVRVLDNAPSAIVNTAAVSGANLPAATLPSNEVQLPLAPTVIQLERFVATLAEQGVRVDWRTSLERDTLGFNVWRSNTGSREGAVKVNAALIAGAGAQGGSYSVVDADGVTGASYWVEEIELNGTSVFYGPARVATPAAAAAVTGELPGQTAARVETAPVAQVAVNGQLVIAGGETAVTVAETTLGNATQPAAAQRATGIGAAAEATTSQSTANATSPGNDRAATAAGTTPGNAPQPVDSSTGYVTGTGPAATTTRDATVDGVTVPSATGARPNAVGLGLGLAALLSLAGAAGLFVMRRRKLK
jgi:uncharacterized repeat protein (TIGR01451 family)